MSENNNHNTKKDTSSSSSKKISRRDVIKGMATLPVAGAFVYGAAKQYQLEERLKQNLKDGVNMSFELPDVAAPEPSEGKQLRLGIIGFGGRGEHLVRAAGYAHPEVIDEWLEGHTANKLDKRYEDYLAQEDLNVVITAVCDVFDIRAERGLLASSNYNKGETGNQKGNPAKRYFNFRELLAADDVDAVIIATPDHWHAEIAIATAEAGKHVYLEKPMTRTVAEVYKVRDAIKKNGVVFQLGHQGRQTESYIKAKEAIEKNVLGKITLIEVCTNRNDPNGAWVYDIHPDASPANIDWNQFLGNAPKMEFSPERFFRWRCWWDYGTGLSGDLLTHEFDAINQIMGIGIPKTAVASGGIYYYKDGREVPDVYQAVMEYPDKDLSFLYSATLASQRQRGKVVMGHDAHMELGGNLMIYADPRSTQYKEKIEQNIIDPSLPIYAYRPGMKGVDAITSATEKYFAGRGLLYTYRGGRRIDTTHLHIKEWIDAIRKGVQPSCNIDQGFEEAITAHMSTIAYRENRKVYWDYDNEVIDGYEPCKEGIEVEYGEGIKQNEQVEIS